MIATALVALPLVGGAPPTDPRLSDLAPGSTIAWAETDEHGAILELGLEHPLVALALETPAVRERGGERAEGALAAAEAFLGTSPLGLVRDLTEGGIGVGLIGSRDGEPRPFVVARGPADDDRFEDALELVTSALSGFGALRAIGADEARRLGVEAAWRAPESGGYVCHLSGRRLLAVASPADLAACLAAGRARAEGGLAGIFADHGEAPAPGGTFLWADLDLIDASGALKDLRAMEVDPGAHFVLGPAITHLGRASEISLAARVDEAERITLEVVATGPRLAEAQAATLPPGRDRTPRVGLAPSSADVARVDSYRSIGALLDRRVDLFDAKALPGIAEGIGNLALLVDGPDGVDALLGALRPELSIVAVDVDFEGLARPDIPLPAACLVGRLDDVGENGARLQQAFQRIVTLGGVQRAMEGEPGFLLGLEAKDGVTITKAELPAPEDGEPVDPIHNLAPGCCVVGDVFVVGTHHRAVADVASRLRAGRDRTPPRGEVDALQLRGDALGALVAENRALLVNGAVLREGKPRRLAEADVDTLLAITRSIEAVRARTEAHATADGRRLGIEVAIDLAR